MEILLLVASLVGFIALTLGTALFVAAEFSLTALERSTITADVADSDRSVIVEQVTNGVAVRMAVLYLLLGGSEPAVGGDE